MSDVQFPDGFRHYDEGWNARVRGARYETYSSPDWRSGYNDCAEAPKDDQTFMVGPDTPRPHVRADGILTRNDIQYDTRLEREVRRIIELVETSGSSSALTDAVLLLSQARNRIADHFEKWETSPTPPPAGDMVLVPREALNWLFGEGPDAQGHWFGDGDNPAMSRGRFWWRTNFRNMLTAAPLPAQEVSGWQSMESAPKDGTWILVWDGEQQEEIQENGYSTCEIVRYRDETKLYGGWRTWGKDELFPTHWRPLPAPPALRPGKD